MLISIIIDLFKNIGAKIKNAIRTTGIIIRANIFMICIINKS